MLSSLPFMHSARRSAEQRAALDSLSEADAGAGASPASADPPRAAPPACEADLLVELVDWHLELRLRCLEALFFAAGAARLLAVPPLAAGVCCDLSNLLTLLPPPVWPAADTSVLSADAASAAISAAAAMSAVESAEGASRVFLLARNHRTAPTLLRPNRLPVV